MRHVVNHLRPHWTAQEDAALRKHYVRSGAARVCALTGRSWRAVLVRAQVLGVTSRRRWTAREDKVLALEWGEVGVRTLRSKLPGRKWGAIVWRAKQLGLGSAAQGRISIAAAARAAGFERPAMLKILATEGVTVERLASGHLAPKRKAERLLVEPDAVTDAVKRWLTRETITQGAQRVGIARATMRTRMERAGILRRGVRGRTVYYLPEEIDRAMAAWVPMPRHPRRS